MRGGCRAGQGHGEECTCKPTRVAEREQDIVSDFMRQDAQVREIEAGADPVDVLGPLMEGPQA